MTQPLPRLHAVTNSDVLTLSDFAPRAESLGRCPGIALHARARELPGRRLAEFAAEMKGFGPARVFVNDRADVALAVEAHGIHLPAHGLPIAAARRLVGPDMWIGRSTHSPDEARRAVQEGADYVFLGPIWKSRSHPEHAGIGVRAIEQALPARVIAIGGVTPDRVERCRAAGAYGVAGISSLWHAEEPGAVAAGMLLLLEPRDS